MRAVWYDRQGAADEVLVCGELPTPEAGHGEVRVRLEVSGVNPSDTYRRSPTSILGAPAVTVPMLAIEGMPSASRSSGNSTPTLAPPGLRAGSLRP
jgi:NADPH:quinone reductase-like Zn-dependent oxidoreductase